MKTTTKTTKKTVKKATSNAPQSSSIADKIKPVSESEEFLSALFYGRSGTGKTTLASSFPKPVLFADIREKGTTSVSDVEEVDFIPIEEWDDVEALYWHLKANPKNYATLVLDTVTQLQDMAMKEVKSREGREEEDPMTQQLWGQVSGLVKQWILAFRDLKINLVLVAQDREIKIDDDDVEQVTPTVGPAVMPSVSKIVNAAVNIIGYTFIKEVTKQKKGKIFTRMEYHLRVGPHPFYTTKIRSPKRFKVPTSIKNPDYATLISITKGEFTNGEESEGQ